MEQALQTYIQGILNSPEYKEYAKIRDKVKLYPDLKAKIDEFVDAIFEKIVDKNWENENLFSGFTLLGYHIMNSLRDTDTQLIIELD